MYVIIENVLLFIAIYFGLIYGKVSQGILMQKLYIFLLICIASLAIRFFFNVINKTSFPLSDMLIRSLFTGLIGTLGYYVLLDITNENLIPRLNTINKNILIPSSIIGMNVLVQLTQLIIKSNYLSLS